MLTERKLTGRRIPGKALNPLFVKAILKLSSESLYTPACVAEQICGSRLHDDYQKWRKRSWDWINYHTTKTPDGPLNGVSAWTGESWQSFIDDADKIRAGKQEEPEPEPKQPKPVIETKEKRKYPYHLWLAAITGLVIFVFFMMPTEEQKRETFEQPVVENSYADFASSLTADRTAVSLPDFPHTDFIQSLRNEGIDTGEMLAETVISPLNSRFLLEPNLNPPSS